jgi:hypothetical protein
MRMNEYWIVRTDPDNYKIFSDDKNAHPYIENLNLLRDGKSLSEVWEPVLLPLYAGNPEDKDEEYERSKPIPDFARGVFGLAMNEKAYSILQSLITNQAIFLKLNTEVGLYYELDIQKISCLDVEKSKVKRFSSGRIMRVEKYCFDYKKLRGAHIFCITELGYPNFVSDHFKEVVEKNKLTGLTFHPVPLVDEES